MSDDLIRTLLTIAFGAIAGGTTNALAVWMLFHPYEPPRFLGRRVSWLQGAIPKNKGRLASAMGRTVGNKLLTPDDITRILAEPSFRAAFDERLAVFLDAAFHRDRGSLSSVLPPHAAAEVRTLLIEAADGAVVALDRYLAGDAFRTAAERWIDLVLAELDARPVTGLLTAEREAALTDAAGRWLEEAVEGDAFAEAVRDYMDRAAVRLLQPDRTFDELLPRGLVGAVERAIAGYLPIAIERLGGMLDDPRARARVEQVLHELLDRFVRDLRFHQRLFAALVITPDTVDRVLRAVEKEGASKLAELLHDPSVREAMAAGVNNAITDFLARPVVEVLGEPGDESVENAKETMLRGVLALARDPQTRGFAVEKLQDLLRSAHGRTWGDLLRHVPRDRVADAVVAAAGSERARELSLQAAHAGVEWIMERPIGRVADRLGEDAAPRVERALADPLWSWLQDQVPTLARRLEIGRRVEDKILEFPTADLESLVRGVTERELYLIIRLGYVLGAIIGMVSAGLAFAFS